MNVVPESVRAAARRAFDARPVETLVADLMFDSVLDHDRRAAADPTVRTMRFGHRNGGADLRVTDRSGGRRVSMDVLPAQRASAEVRCAGATFSVTTDDEGHAEFDVPIGLFSVVLRPLRSPQAKPLQTSWVRL
ncbi:hypothetical protein [Cryptosporangium aurantiacum]|uniref:Uncharacterized protein n=1 Tax=Cryptosporangium aurantiacum TaxID=134849 RepID=A0A1M7RJP2_9ACTN|nr:hypothetical protein [Cryptosporangium aurantiacum]SHN46371.1 hypothetical protein SAMN05443668_11557 [Cryptosporangium aurantiacum]